MPHAQVRHDLSIYFEIDGDPAHPPLILIAGQSAQLISWHPQFCRRLVESGFRVIRFDNRDAGLSTRCVDRPYELFDMADDVAALLDHLNVPAAHVVGQSMGGMIAQYVAIRHVARVQSLCSVYSAPSPQFITSSPQVWGVREEAPATDRESAIEQYIRREHMSGWAEWTEPEIRAYAETYIDRGYDPAASDRQMAAVRRSDDRTDALAALKVPTAVIHGLDDLLIESAGGVATALAVPNAELHVYADMGHQLIPSLFDDYARVIARNAARAAH